MAKGGDGEGATVDRDKPLREYIERRQATVAEWVALRPVFEVCAKETGFEGGGRAQEKWWNQTAVENQLKNTLKYISAVARERCRQKFGRSVEAREGRKSQNMVMTGEGRGGDIVILVLWDGDG